MGEFSVGVAGCGSIATERHIPVIKKNRRANLSGVYDHNFPNAERVAQRFDIPGMYDEYEPFLEDLDVVTIAAPPFAHHDLTVPALESGTHVLCEKPFAVEKADAEAMVEAAQNSTARLGIVHNFLFSNSVLNAKELVQAGDVGEIQYVKGFQLSSPSRGLPSWYTELPYDLFFDESPHLLYLMEEFVGELAPRHVEPRFNEERLQSLTATFSGGRGKVGQLSMLFDAPLSEWYLCVVGTERVLVVDIFRDVLYTFDRELSHSPIDVLQTSFSAISQIIAGIVKSGVHLVTGELHFGFDVLFERYLRAIETGEPLPINEIDGYRIFETMYEVIEFEE